VPFVGGIVLHGTRLEASFFTGFLADDGLLVGMCFF
jgi:hypothetical protein